MEGIDVVYFPYSIDPGSNEGKSELHSYISDDNEQYACSSYDSIFHQLRHLFDSGILVCGMSTVWEDTDSCDKQYMCALAIYWMILLLSSCGILTNITINAPGHWKNVVDGLNTTDKNYLKGEMELIVKLESNDTSNIGMLPSDSKDVYIKFSDQFIHILNNKERLNELKGSTKIQNRESLFKYQ